MHTNTNQKGATVLLLTLTSVTNEPQQMLLNFPNSFTAKLRRKYLEVITEGLFLTHSIYSTSFNPSSLKHFLKCCFTFTLRLKRLSHKLQQNGLTSECTV